MTAIVSTAVEGVEARVGELGRALIAAARERNSAFWAREHWEEALLRKLMVNERFRIQALRFVDVLPALTDDEALVQHLREYFGEESLPLPGAARWGMEVAAEGMAAHLVAGAVRAAMHGLATRFIGGAHTREALQTVEGLRREGMAFSLDLLGEATVSEAEAEAYQARYLRLFEEAAPIVARWKPNPLLDRVSGRPSPRLNVSVKLSALFSQLSAVDPAGCIRALKERLRPICRLAREKGAFVCLDMEQYETKEITLRLLRELLMEPEFRDWPDVGLAMQAYLRETEVDLASLIDWVRQRGAPVTVRLVRGAYWDYETVIARQHGWPAPVWNEKWETDRNYERCVRLLIENHPHIEAAFATHNARSLALALAMAEAKGLHPDQFEIQMLYGMADPLKDAVAERGRRVRVYVPYGEVLPGMAYLVRRLLENTASQSFLRMGFADDLAPDTLLAPPGPAPSRRTTDRALPAAAPSPTASVGSAQPSPFRTEPPRRFTLPAERERFASALERVKKELGREYPALLHGRAQTTGNWFESVNPARPTEIIGRVAAANERDAETAVRSARSAFPGWRDRAVGERIALLLRAAEKLRARRDEFAAWQVLEAGKTWREADADVIEAIDFLEYYSREALRLSALIPLHAPGEANTFFYQPRGVCVVIPPWNFPLAIAAGMTAAALVTGNTVVLKPAPQTPVIAAKFVEVLRECGLEPGVLNFVPSLGAAVGEALVAHPQVDCIAFTGSRAVGCRIFARAAEVAPGQNHLKRVIAEMGGKNAIIVDEDADPDDAVLGTLWSAFGFQGQKCSAASRVIVIGKIHDTFVRRLVDAARSLTLGPPDDPGAALGPVIDARARDRIRQAIEAGKQTARPVLETDVSALGDGYYVGPTIFTDADPGSAFCQEEIFGPVLAVLRAATFSQALEIAMRTDYALTGGVYSRSPDNLERACREFRVGNLYLNRKITGAVVGRQPFGGFRMSGIGSKAGGPDYLLQFLEPRTITENTLRRGFAAAADEFGAVGGVQ